jgi:AcrR family transcriptional regulator
MYANNVVGNTLPGGSAVAGQEKDRQQINGSVEQRRKEIVAAAGRLFMKKGYQATSMRELARTLHLDVASLYRYVPSKGDLLVLMAQEVTDAVAHSLKETVAQAPTAEEAVRLAFSQYVRLVDRYSEYYKLFYRCFDWLSQDLRDMLLDGEHRIVQIFQRLLEQQGYASSNARCLAWDFTVLGEMWAVKRWAFHPFMGLDDYIIAQWSVAKSALNAFGRAPIESEKPVDAK